MYALKNQKQKENTLKKTKTKEKIFFQESFLWVNLGTQRAGKPVPPFTTTAR
jgi:hypothetical protein